MQEDSVPKPGAPQVRGTPPEAPGPRPDPRVLVSNRQDRPIDESGLARLAASVLAAEGRPGVELSLSFVTPEEMEDLHVRYMDEPGATDVLSFPMEDEELVGDVIVCPEEAERNNRDVEAELRLLVAHGVLHLLGYDHDEEDDRRRMWTRQERYSGVRAR